MNKKGNFIIGYSGSKAIVNKKLYKKNRRFSAAKLLEQGLLSAACRAALLEQDSATMAQIATMIGAEGKGEGLEQHLRAVFGVSSLPVVGYVEI